MKKVLYITTVSSTVNAFLVPHIETLINNGYKVDCAFSVNKPLDNSIVKLGVNQYDIPFSRNPLSFSNLKAFRKLIEIQKENNYDIVHVHTPVASIYGRLLKLKFKQINVIYTVHGYHFFKGGSKLGWLIYYPIEKIMGSFTDIIININSEDYELTKKKIKHPKVYLVKGVGINLEKYTQLSKEEKDKKRKEIGINENDFIITMIAELNKNKNQIQLIRAIEKINKECPRLKVLFIGEGPKIEYLKKEGIRRGVEEKLIFLGFRKDINELINISDIGALLSYREGLPRSIMEFMANGKNIIATNIRGCKDLISNDNIGKLVDVGDYETTGNVIQEYYNKKYLNKINDTHQNGSKKEFNECNIYSIKNINSELLEIYKLID